MENLAGEKEVSSQRILNLNTRAFMRGKQRRKHYVDFHFRSDGIKIVGKEDDIQECKECHKILPLTAFTTYTPRVDGAYYLRKICRECSCI